MDKDRVFLSIQTVKDDIQILQSSEQYHYDAGYFLQLEHLNHILRLLQFEAFDKLVFLPCKLNEILYIVPTYSNSLKEITEVKCIGFSIGNPSNTAELLNKKGKLYSASFDMFGESVFKSFVEANEVFEANNAQQSSET